MAERVGFEPTAPCGVTGFQDQLLKPLGHLSITVLLYQIGPIISNNVISYKKKAGLKPAFSCVFVIKLIFQLFTIELSIH